MGSNRKTDVNYLQLLREKEIPETVSSTGIGRIWGVGIPCGPGGDKQIAEKRETSGPRESASKV